MALHLIWWGGVSVFPLNLELTNLAMLTGYLAIANDLPVSNLSSGTLGLCGSTQLFR